MLKLPRRRSGLGYEIEDEVALKFYRLQKISEGGIDLSPGDADPLKGPTEVGTGRYEDEAVVLSQLIATSHLMRQVYERLRAREKAQTSSG